MAVTSETEICNLALSRIGHKLITSLMEDSRAAELCNLHYARARNSLLRSYPWNFAIRRATLALSSTTPNHEYTYQHTLPTDCLKVIRTNWEADGSVGTAVYGSLNDYGYSIPPLPYRIEGRHLLCNEETVKIEYIAEVTDVAQFDELFVDVLAQRLAAEIALALTDNQALTKGMWDIYQAKLVEARLVDSMEGTPRDIVNTSGWLAARL